MADEIDIKEHDIFDSPHLQRIFPDITKLKQEIEYATEQYVDICNPPTKVKVEDVSETVISNEPPNATNISQQNVYGINRHITENNEYVFRNIKTENEHNTQVYIETTSKALVIPKEEHIPNCTLEYDSVLKKEIVCSKEPDETTCKKLNSVEEVDSCFFPEINKGGDVLNGGNVTLKPSEEAIAYGVSKHMLKCHTKTKHTSERNHLCDLCEYKAATKSQLDRHILIHSGEKPYKCDFCDHRSSRIDVLNYHIRAKHTNEKKYSCDLCEYKSVKKTNLKEHLQTHTGEKPHICDLCEYRTTRISHLNFHIKTKHTNVNDYSCHVCEYKTVTKRQLDRHLRTHTGEKPFQCDLCDYRSSRMDDLNYHKKGKHANEKNYSCDICEYKTLTKRQLNRHLRTHTGEKPHECDFCDYRSSRIDVLNYHIRAKHKNEKE